MESLQKLLPSKPCTMSTSGESGYSSDVERGSSISNSNHPSRCDSDGGLGVGDYGATTAPTTVNAEDGAGLTPPLGGQTPPSGDFGRHSTRSLRTSQRQHEDEPHLGASRQYWRDIILGVNDGLVSTFLLVAGVAGGGLSSADILLTAISGAIAGAVSMCAGEYVATKSQNEVLEGELSLERRHIENFQDHELNELRSHLLQIIGISCQEHGNLTDQLVEHYKNDADALLKIMTVLEFGVLDQEVRSPIKAGLFSSVLFTVGALPSIIPFIFLDPLEGLMGAALTATLALLVVGAVKTYATRGHWLTAAMENLFIAGFGGGFAYAVGVFFDRVLHTGASAA